MSAICCNATRHMSSAVAPFAYGADPPEFQRACFWYLVRLRAGAVLFGASAILNASSCVIAKCRYKSLTHSHFTPISF
uniref:Secreted protein n=1 Tax=Ascaris lumbricoides TaxID=6252 RepID=A0A0M3ID12_ASCLU